MVLLITLCTFDFGVVGFIWWFTCFEFCVAGGFVADFMCLMVVYLCCFEGLLLLF